MGRQLATRGEIVSQVWQYVRDNHLQNPENGRFFRPDQRLATLLGREGEYINGLTILGHLKNHYRQN
jgi:chromatin remodeling complex protein RSC6